MNLSAAIPPDSGEGPGYQEPWQAQAFACAIRLIRTGLFSSSEWTQALSEEIRLHPAREDESAIEAYYRQLLDALERVIRDKAAVSGTAIAQRIEAWRQAYLNTPHGQAVELQNASSVRAPPRTPRHEAMRKPVTVSPPQK